MGKYIEERDKKYLNKLRTEIIPELPSFCEDFFIGISTVTTVLTRYNYGTDLLLFFHYLTGDYGIFQNIGPKEITLNDLSKIKSRDIERFLDHISGYYTNYTNEYVKNHDRAKARKLCSIRSLFKYLYNHDMIAENVTAKVAIPKTREKEIIKLENNEVNEVFDLIESNNAFISDQQNSYNNNNTKIRDNAIITLLLGTGIRVSECVGLNINDINFNNKTFLITRKGEKQAILYLNDEIIDAIQKYIETRNEQLKRKKIDPNEVDALFLSLQNKRISVRAVEILVKKYTQIINPLKNITPHKLRSTYGTALYRETNDIYVVAEVLGHKDINTTKKHYAAISEDIKKSASDKVNFRKNKFDKDNT